MVIGELCQTRWGNWTRPGLWVLLHRKNSGVSDFGGAELHNQEGSGESPGALEDWTLERGLSIE